MSAVVKAVQSVVNTVVDAVDKYVVEPIKNDPLTFLATVAGAAIAGPGAFGMAGMGYGSIGMGVGAGLGNTAAGLAQGEDFDTAIKGGAIAGLTTWAGVEGSQYLKGTSAPPIEDRALSNAFKGIDNAATQSVDDIFTSAAKESVKLADDAAAGSANLSTPANSWSQSVARAGSEVADDSLSNSLNTLDDGFNAAGNPKPTGMPDASLQGPGNAPTDLYGNKNPDFTSSSASPGVGKDVTGGVYSSSANPAMDASAASGTLKTPTLAETNASVLKSPSIEYGTGDTSYGSYNAPTPSPELSTWDKAMGYGSDAWKWAKDNPAYSVPLALTGASLIGGAMQDDPPSGGGNNDQIGDSSFYEPMRLYDYNRTQKNYGDDLYTYGQTGGEHQFFTPSVYTPINFATGGSVSPDNYGYYTYGNIPPTMRGFAQGGLSALAKGGNFDGRSDDIPAVLSDGEFVIDAETVALLGNGSSKAGANRLEEMRQSVRKQKGGALSRGQFSPDAKSPLAYLKSSKRSRG
jgi:hypothetical protein